MWPTGVGLSPLRQLALLAQRLVQLSIVSYHWFNAEDSGFFRMGSTPQVCHLSEGKYSNDPVVDVMLPEL